MPDALPTGRQNIDRPHGYRSLIARVPRASSYATVVRVDDSTVATRMAHLLGEAFAPKTEYHENVL